MLHLALGGARVALLIGGLTSLIAIPLALSLLVWVIYIGTGLKHQGLGYFGHLLWPPGVPTALKPLVGLIEFISTIIVTPDHERTMFTCLAACRAFGPGDCSDPFPDCRWLYFTGYMWDTENQKTAVQGCAEEARRRGVDPCRTP